jgi:hypothetical protein
VYLSYSPLGPQSAAAEIKIFAALRRPNKIIDFARA